MIFKNREAAARKMVSKLLNYKDDQNTIVLGLPRGGIAIAVPIAQELNLPIDILVSRKLGDPDQPELAFGAISEDGQTIFNDEVMRLSTISEKDVQRIIEQEQKEAMRRAHTYRMGKKRLSLQGKTVILVDDGIATGATMLVSIASARQQGAKKIIVAIPVAPRDSLPRINQAADEVMYLQAPDYFPGVGAFYEKFAQLTDDDVLNLLKD